MMPPVAAATTAGTIGRRRAAVMLCRPGRWRCITINGIVMHVATDSQTSTHQKDQARYMTQSPHDLQQKIIILIIASTQLVTKRARGGRGEARRISTHWQTPWGSSLEIETGQGEISWRPRSRGTAYIGRWRCRGRRQRAECLGRRRGTRCTGSTARYKASCEEE